MNENDESTDRTAAPARILVQAPKGLPPKVVARYVDNCRTSLLALQSALERSDYESARIFGHRMKGTGAAYGFPELTQTGASIERAAAAHSASELQDQAAALEAYLGRVDLAGS